MTTLEAPRTLDELRAYLDTLAPNQRKWLRAKQAWEHMSALGVLSQWTVPRPHQLNADGTWRAMSSPACSVCGDASDPECGNCRGRGASAVRPGPGAPPPKEQP